MCSKYQVKKHFSHQTQPIARAFLFLVSVPNSLRWKNFSVIRKRNKLHPVPSHLAKRKFTFFSFLLCPFLASQLTKIVILLRNHIYMCFVAANSTLVSCMADFEQFIYFILRCACFQGVFFFFHRLHRLGTRPLASLWCSYYGKRKKFYNNFMTLWQSARSNFFSALIYAEENTLKNFSHFF